MAAQAGRVQPAAAEGEGEIQEEAELEDTDVEHSMLLM
jgi:hypothetical protein